MDAKKFVGRVKTVETKYGEMMKISIGAKDWECQTGGWLNMILKKGKNGYYLELDTWKPSQKNEKPVINIETDDDIPF